MTNTSRGDTLRIVRQALRGAFEILGELGRDGEGTIAWLARESGSGALAAIRSHSDASARNDDVSVEVRHQLDASLPAHAVGCPSCQAAIHDWGRFCPSCGHDLATGGTGPQAHPDSEPTPLPDVNSYDLIGDLRRAEGGEPVFFARHPATRDILAVRLVPGQDAPSVEITRTLRAVQPDDADDEQNDTDDAAADAFLCMVCGATYPADIWFCPRDGSALKPTQTTADLVGHIVAGRYRLIECIGAGATGIVYRAEHVRIGRTCALKIMNPVLKSDPEALGRFGREASNASRITHPNVVSVLDFGESDEGLIYLAMEFANGESLAVMIAREAPFETARAAELGRQIADALAAAHEQGLIHRDLKPDNIVVGRRGDTDVAKLVDFGIARTIHGDAALRLTRTGHVIGTPRYMSPEQLAGEPVDERSDLYSLGCILYELVTGEPAFDGPDSEIIAARRLAGSAPDPAERNAALPEEFRTVITRSLARDPRDRFASAAQMAQTLASIAEASRAMPVAMPMAPRAAPVTPRLFRPSVRFRNRMGLLRRRMPWAAAFAGVSLLLAMNMNRRPEHPPVPAGAAKRDLASGIELLPAAPVTPDIISPSPHASATRAVSPAQVLPAPRPSRRVREPAAGYVTVPLEKDSVPATTTAPAVVPPREEIELIRALLAGAQSAREAGDYTTAFVSIDRAKLRISQLRVAFPNAAAVNELDREEETARAETVRICNELRRVRLDLGLPTPVCSAGG